MNKCIINRKACAGYKEGKCISIENCMFQEYEEEDEGMNRRKLKGERELASDINKRFNLHCQNTECRDCKYLEYRGIGRCKINYLADLLGEREIKD